MTSLLDRLRLALRSRRARETAVQTADAQPSVPAPVIDIAPDDPILPHLAQSNGVVDVERITIDSPALRKMKASGVKLVVPLVNQGEVVALLNLGPRRSEQDYSRDDRVLLNTLALQAAPAVRVAQMVREQQIEAVERERLQQEMNVARQIQFTLLPKEDPNLPGYHLEKYYEPARAVGGDFYDFFELSDGQLVMIVGDVSGKGVPAALVMANTRSVLRGAARRMISPGEVLSRANTILIPEMPAGMFVTCLCAMLHPSTGRLRYANAGHNPPYRRGKEGVEEMFARGMPLGILPDRTYEEMETCVEPGDCVLFYSDGVTEAHNPSGEMFGFDRLKAMMLRAPSPDALDTVGYLQRVLHDFTGTDWDQEDDISVLALERHLIDDRDEKRNGDLADPARGRATLTHFSVASVPGNERIAMQRVADVVQPFGLTRERFDGLMTAVAEATMNAIEYGNRHDASLPVDIDVAREGHNLIVRVTDHGAGDAIPMPQQPDLDKKLAGEQPPRGWGLFLIKSLVDDMRFSRDPDTRYLTIELVMRLNTPDTQPPPRTFGVPGAEQSLPKEGDSHP